MIRFLEKEQPQVLLKFPKDPTRFAGKVIILMDSSNEYYKLCQPGKIHIHSVVTDFDVPYCAPFRADTTGGFGGIVVLFMNGLEDQHLTLPAEEIERLMIPSRVVGQLRSTQEASLDYIHVNCTWRHLVGAWLESKK
jgi:hypothetical protein